MKPGTLIVMLKAPKAGRVKTRLGREIGMGAAAALFRRMSEQTLHEAGKGRWRKVIAVDPPSDMFGWRALWPAAFERMAQGTGDLGVRMRRMMRAAEGPVVIIGADAPRLRARHISAAFKSLGRADAVFGPAEDGGYWLIGLARRAPSGLFEGVRWSSEHALADTLQSLPASYDVDFLERLADLDDAKDLRAAQPLLRARR